MEVLTVTEFVDDDGEQIVATVGDRDCPLGYRLSNVHHAHEVDEGQGEATTSEDAGKVQSRLRVVRTGNVGYNEVEPS